LPTYRLHTNRRALLTAALACVSLAPFAALMPAASAEPAPGSVVINEVESQSGAPGDWVELMNTGSSAADVSGWVVKDNDDTHMFVIPAASSIPAGGFLALDVDASFGLGGADSARLFAADGTTLVDTYSWLTHAATTYGRCPNGTGAFVTTTSSTKGAANDCSAPIVTTVKINEVESSGGTPGDWVELINNGAVSANLAGYVLKDNDDTHGYVLPAGFAVPAGGYAVLNESEFNFGLGAADSARLFAPDGTTIVDTYSWTAHAATTYGRCPNGTGAFVATVSSTKGAANDCVAVAGPTVVINEVESSGGAPGDWVELMNTGSSAADVSGWVVRDNDDTHALVIPAVTSIAAGGFLALDVETSYGLGAADSARLFAADGTTLIDTYSWLTHAATTYGRCPNGTGALVVTASSTKGAANDCSPVVPVDPPAAASPWPGGAAVATADTAGFFGTNLSGLAYEASGTAAPGTIWAVRNGPSTLYRLLPDGTAYAADTANGWGAGKSLHYANGTGDPDAEGVTLTDAGPAGGIYVSTERDNNASAVSRPAVLRFDASGSASSLNATTEWNLTSDLPPVAPNSGLEAISWISDSFLVSKGFYDEHTGATYNPASYAGHGTGLFFVGLEANGAIYAYALSDSGAFTRVATIASGFVSIMDLEFEPETTHLWAECDNTCDGRTATLDIAQSGPAAGRFVVTNVYERPSSLPNVNNEGFAIAPQAECVNGLKPVFWSDDDQTGGHALRSGTIDCVVPAVIPDPAPSDDAASPAVTPPVVTTPLVSTPVAAAASAEALAQTGVSARYQAIAALLALLLGASMLMAGRRGASNRLLDRIPSRSPRRS
jgi:hypothetical protein